MKLHYHHLLLLAVASFLSSALAFVAPSSGLSSPILHTAPSTTSRPDVPRRQPDSTCLYLFGRMKRLLKKPQPRRRGEGYGVPLEDISQAVGNTPLVKISDRLCPPGRTMYAKAEYFNPLSSVKDRLALSIIETAEQEGKLKPGDTVIEATSGNTGIAVAMMCAQRGYKCVITMAEPFSVERRKLMRMLGAKVIVTPKAGKRNGYGGKGSGIGGKTWMVPVSSI
jgi:hypothetical protein